MLGSEDALAVDQRWWQVRVKLTLLLLAAISLAGGLGALARGGLLLRHVG